MVLEHLVTGFGQVASIPQLHESTLGMYITSTDLDQGSHNANLVCRMSEKAGVLAKGIHPEIKFSEPMQDIHVKVTGNRGNVVWDSYFNLGGQQLLAKTAMAAGGSVPNWNKICTPKGERELYTMQIAGTGVKSGYIDTSVTFTSDNGSGVYMPERALPPRVPFPGGNPLAAPVVAVHATDFNPLKYLSYSLS